MKNLASFVKEEYENVIEINLIKIYGQKYLKHLTNKVEDFEEDNNDLTYSAVINALCKNYS